MIIKHTWINIIVILSYAPLTYPRLEIFQTKKYIGNYLKLTASDYIILILKK